MSYNENPSYALVTQLPSITATQYDVLVGGAANAIVSVGPGTAGQVFQSGGNASNPAYSTATYPATAGTSGNVLKSDGTNVVSSSFSGNLVLIQSQTASNSASISFTTGVTGYDKYRLYVEFAEPANGGNPDLTLVVSTNGGSSYDNANYKSAIGGLNIPGNQWLALSANLTTAFFLTQACGNGLGFGSNGYCDMFGLTNGSTPVISTLFTYDRAGSLWTTISGGSYANASVNAIRIIYTVGNITSGTFKLYGIVN